MKRLSWRPFIHEALGTPSVAAGTDRLHLPGAEVGPASVAGAAWRRLTAGATTWPGAALLGLTALGLGLRCWGLWWGAPARSNFHPDEMNHVIEHAARVLGKVSAVAQGKAPFTFDTLDPGFLNYPGFLMYLIAGITGALRAMGLLGEEMWQLHIVGRAVSAAFGAATVAVVFLITSELGARRVASVLAAVWMALMPLHVWESHIAVTDVMMTFWISLTLYFALRILRDGSERTYVLAGVSLGLAAGSKYTALLAVVPVIVAAGLSGRAPASMLRGLTLAAAASLLSCVLVTPYSFLRFQDFLAAMSYEYDHARSMQYGFSLPAEGLQYRKYLYQVVAAWPFSLGFALYGSVAAGAAWAALTMDRRRAVLLSFAVVLFGVTGSWNFAPLRYYMPILVVGVVFAGMWQAAWLAGTATWQRHTARVVVIVTLLYTAVFTVQTTARFRNDTRIQAGEWIGRHVKVGSRLLMIGPRPYVGTPPDEDRFEVNFLGHNAIWLMDHRPDADLIEVTSLMYARAYRHHLRPHRRIYDRLRTRGRLVARFQSDFLNKRAYVALDPMFEGYFVSPTIELYARR
jgi:hypothetical protein